MKWKGHIRFFIFYIRMSGMRKRLLIVNLLKFPPQYLHRGGIYKASLLSNQCWIQFIAPWTGHRLDFKAPSCLFRESDDETAPLKMTRNSVAVNLLQKNDHPHPFCPSYIHINPAVIPRQKVQVFNEHLQDLNAPSRIFLRIPPPFAVFTCPLI